MYMNRVGNSITIAVDSEEEARGLLAALSGTPTANQKANTLGSETYTFFYRAIYALASNFSQETKGINLLFPGSDRYRDPRKGHRTYL